MTIIQTAYAIKNAVDGTISALARRPWLAVCVVGALNLLLCAMGSLARDFPPVPRVHDEFGILLAADTYAHGRLTNPPHPLSQFFDTIHVIQHPTYQGKYPPMQGIMLAIGKLLTGHFIVGAWISCGIMGGAICWMLQGYLSPRWALYGALIATAQLGPFCYWAHSYWGSHMAVAGGALVLGAVIRMTRKPQGLQAVLLAIGLMILANSRPYDGLALSLIPMGVLALRFWRGPAPWRNLFVRRALPPFAAVMILGLSAMAYNNHVVTGNALKLPYREHTDQYMIIPAFLWQRPATVAPQFSHPTIREYHDVYEREMYMIQRSLKGYLLFRTWGLGIMREFYLGWLLVLPFVAGVFYSRRRGRWIPLLSLLLVIGSAMLTTWISERFIAAAASAIFLCVTLGMRRLSYLLPDVPRKALLLALLVTLPFTPLHRPEDHPMANQRSRVLRELESESVRQLVFVQTEPGFDVHAEWVYNGAEIDQQQIVFARYFDPQENRKLIDYYPGRKVWLLKVGPPEKPVSLLPYPQ